MGAGIDMAQRKLRSAALPYRPCVGIMLLNSEGHVWMGRRLPKWARRHAEPFWQMPQGGIRPGEPPEDACRRELAEETGVESVSLLGVLPVWLTYDLPDDLVGIALKGRYRGQRLKWFAMRFEGVDSEIDLTPPPGCKPEFDDWRWVPMDEVASVVTPLKRPIYKTVVDAFRHLA